MAAGGSLLASKYVEISQKGAGSVVAYMVQLQEEMKRAGYQQQQLNRHLKDGTYQKTANQVVALRKQYEAMQKSARFQDLIAEHGKFGASLAMIQEKMSGVASGASWGFAAVTGATMGWVTAGMAGTIEANRLQNAFWFLSHGIAGVFKPTIDDATQAVYKAAYWFRGLSGEQQETLRTAVLWTAGILGGALALRLLVKAVAGLRAAYMLLLPAMDALITKQTYLNIAQAAGGSRALILGGLKATAVGAALYGLNELTTSSDEKHRQRYGGGVEMALGSAARGLEVFGRMIIGEGWLWGSMNPHKKGTWMERANLEEAEKWGSATDEQKKRLEELRTEKKRTDVTPFTAGFGSSFTGVWDEISNRVLELDDPMLRTTLGVEEIRDILRNWFHTAPVGPGPERPV